MKSVLKLFEKVATVICAGTIVGGTMFAFLSNDKAEKSTTAEQFLFHKMSADAYGKFIDNLRRDFAIEFPDKASRIIIADRRQPLYDSVHAAAKQWGLEQDGAFFDFMKKEMEADDSFTFPESDPFGGQTIAYHDGKGNDYCMAFGYGPEAEGSAFILIKRHFHELSHCLDQDVVDVDSPLNAQKNGNDVVDLGAIDSASDHLKRRTLTQIRVESFAEIAATSMLFENGVYTRADALALATTYSKGPSRPAQGWFNIYQPSEGIVQLVKTIDGAGSYTFNNGPISGLHKAFDRAREAQAAAGYDEVDIRARLVIGLAYSDVFAKAFKGNAADYNSWLEKHRALQEAGRTAISNLYQNLVKQKGAAPNVGVFLPARLDHARNMAELFSYKQREPDDKALDVLVEGYRKLTYVWMEGVSAEKREASGLTPENFECLARPSAQPAASCVVSSRAP